MASLVIWLDALINLDYLARHIIACAPYRMMDLSAKALLKISEIPKSQVCKLEIPQGYIYRRFSLSLLSDIVKLHNRRDVVLLGASSGSFNSKYSP